METAPNPKRKLKGMLARIFSDAEVDQAERAELKATLGSGALSDAEVREVFDDFVETTWRVTMADGVVSDREKQRLRAIVEELALRPDQLPVEWVVLIAK
jgi:tellurite resistance protein